jgi:hypothetical protein
MSLSNRQGSRGDGGLERAFLCCIYVVYASIVQHTPFITLCDDHVFSQSHDFSLVPFVGRRLSISAMVAFNDDHSIMASMRAAIAAAINATVMFAIRELRSCGAKIAVPMHVPVAANANSQLFRTCQGRRQHCQCGENTSQLFHGFLLQTAEQAALLTPGREQ